MSYQVDLTNINLNSIPLDILREVCIFHYNAFISTVLPHMFYHPTLSPFHKHLLNVIQTKQKTKRREVIVGPRGWGKSTTITEGGPLWIIARNDYLPESLRYKYILLVAETAAQAKSRLLTIKEELEGNEMFRTLFPHAAGKGKIWSSERIVTANDICIAISGVRTSIRGLKYKNRRPDLIIVDDPDSLETVTSPSLATMVEDMFTRDILKCGDENADIFVVGTMLGKQALVYKLLYNEEYAGWKGKKYKALISFPENMGLWDEFGTILKNRELENSKKEAIRFYLTHKEEMDKGGKALWEEVYPVYKLMMEYYLEGRRAFMLEKQNEIIEDEAGLFSLEQYKYYDDDERDKILQYNPLFYAYIDPTGGNKKSVRGIRRAGDSDRFSLMILAKLSNNHIFVWENIAGQFKQSEQYAVIAKTIIKYEQLGTPLFKLIVEDRGDMYYINGLKDFLKRRGIARPIPRVINYRVNKAERISMIEPYLDNWTLVLPSNRKDFKYLYEELETYPYSDFDDVLDSLSGCFFACYKTFRLRYA